VRISVLGVHRDGGMAGLIAVPAGNLVPAPGLSADACATVEFLAIGAHAVRRAAVAAGERVLVVGAGPIGLGAALFARLAGGEVTLHDRDAERAAAVAAVAGVAALPAGEDLKEAFDVVFDATGNARAMEQGFDYPWNGGRYVLVGVLNSPITFQDPDFHRKELTLIASRNATSADFEQVLAAIRGGEVPVERIVTHRTRLADAARDLPRWAHEKAGLIKALVEV
jgi:2-desacetyl-2-hydroxyethyl bacteriochlorophyllide A dehydrogenase